MYFKILPRLTLHQDCPNILSSLNWQFKGEKFSDQEQKSESKKMTNKSNLYLISSLLGLSFYYLPLYGTPGQAQTVELGQIRPNQIQPIQPINPPPLQTPPLLPPPEDLLKNPPITPSPNQEIPNIPGTIVVKKFEVLGSTVFSQADFDKILKEFTDKKISFAELLNARSAVTKLYIDNGYVTSGAFIPPQTLEGDVVKIQVVEGELEDIKVTGNKRLNSGYVRSRLALATGKPLKVPRLLEALQLLQLDPLIKNLSAELSAGSRPGQSLLEVKITEANTFQVQLRTDNGRSPSVGTFRRGLQISEGNVTGLGDSFSVTYANTDGSNELDASYKIPVNARNGTINLDYNTTFSTIIEKPFDAVDIEAHSSNYEIGFRQPLLQTPTKDFAVGITAARRESDTSLLGVGFPLSAGADSQGRTRIMALRLYQEFTQRDAQQVFAGRSQFNVGVGVADATINKSLPDSRFFYWRGQLQYLRLLAPDTTLLLRSDIQVAADALVPIEQFGLGGLESVRGYRQDLLLSDSGVFASAELRYPIYRLPHNNGLFQLVPFFDFGTAWNVATQDPSPSSLFAVGLGLRFQQGDRLTASFDYGIGLTDVSTKPKTWQENGLYFSVQYNLF